MEKCSFFTRRSNGQRNQHFKLLLQPGKEEKWLYVAEEAPAKQGESFPAGEAFFCFAL